MIAPQKTHGFTLIEVMITVVIVSIIASIAYPMYADHVRKTRRSDATIGLTTLANALERYYQDCNTYPTTIVSATGCGNGLGYTTSATKDNHYTLSVQAGGTASYTLRATPQASGLQAGDGILQLTSTGVKWHDEDNDSTQDANELDWKW